jgi:MYXO-CTERM domain-containing protein
MHQIRSHLPAALVVLVYATALAVSLSDPPHRGLAGLVVVVGLVARRMRERRRCTVARRTATAVEPVAAPVPAPGLVPASRPA